MRSHPSLTFAILLVVLSLGGLTTWAGVLEVPADFATIQEAIDAALDGDTVLVSPGTYVENLDFLGKAITVISTDGPGVTTIDGDGLDSVVKFEDGEDATSVIEGFTITNGSADTGGGINCVGAFPTIINNTISGNVSTGNGAGIAFIEGANPADIGVVENNTISNNISGGYYGGGVYCYNYSVIPAFVDNTFTENQDGGWGGGLYVGSFGTPSVVVTGNTMSGNYASSPGGGASIFGGTQTVDGNTIVNNTSASGGAGAWIGAFNGGNATLTNSTVSGNTGSWGGGVYIGSYYDGALMGSDPELPLTVSNCTISNNTATSTDYGGGGISAYYGTITLSNTLLVNNTSAAYGGGALLYSFYSSVGPTVLNTTASGNSATYGGGVYFASYSSTLSNSIVWDNTGGQLYQYGGPVNIAADFNDIMGGYVGTGNIDDDPLFVSGPGGDFFLSQIPAGQGADSPAVDAGNPATPPFGTTRTDAGPDSGVIDMGFHRATVEGEFLRGDIDGNGTVNGLVDGLFVLAFQFIPGSPAPPCNDADDVDDSGTLNGLVDGLFLLNYQFIPASPAPPNPGPNTCGPDPTGDGLDCAESPAICL